MAEGQTSSAIRVRTRFDSLETFTDEYGPLFDPKGLFIRTRHMYPIGTSVRFELQLTTGKSVFRGEGRVDRIGSSTPGHAGFHVRLTKLDRESKTLFDSIVQRASLEQSGAPQAFGADPHRAPTLPAIDAPTADPFALGPMSNNEPLIDPELLSHDVLEQIADGIEGTLDSLLSGRPVDPAASAQLAATPGSGPAAEALFQEEPVESPPFIAEEQVPVPPPPPSELFEDALVEPEPEEDEPNTDEMPVYPAEEQAPFPAATEAPIPPSPAPVWSPPIEGELTSHPPKNTDEELAAFMQDLTKHPDSGAGAVSEPDPESAQPELDQQTDAGSLVDFAPPVDSFEGVVSEPLLDVAGQPLAYDPAIHDALTVGPDASVLGEHDLPEGSPDASFLGDPALAMVSNVMGDSGELSVPVSDPLLYAPATMEAEDPLALLGESVELEVLMEPASPADVASSPQAEIYDLDEVSLVDDPGQPRPEPEINFEMIGPPTLKQSELVAAPDVSAEKGDGLSPDIQQDWYAEQEHHRFVTTEDSAELGDLIADLVADDSSLGKHEPPFADPAAEAPIQQALDEASPQLSTLTHQADHTAPSTAKAGHQKRAQREELMKEARLLMDQVDAGSATPPASPEKKSGLFNRVFGRKKKR